MRQVSPGWNVDALLRSRRKGPVPHRVPLETYVGTRHPRETRTTAYPGAGEGTVVGCLLPGPCHLSWTVHGSWSGLRVSATKTPENYENKRSRDFEKKLFGSRGYSTLTNVSSEWVGPVCVWNTTKQKPSITTGSSVISPKVCTVHRHLFCNNFIYSTVDVGRWSGDPVSSCRRMSHTPYTTGTVCGQDV